VSIAGLHGSLLPILRRSRTADGRRGTPERRREERRRRREREREREREKKEEREKKKEGADDGTRTHDLLHGKEPARADSERLRPTDRTVERSRLSAECQRMTPTDTQG
jgi:hypothetical protein